MRFSKEKKYQIIIVTVIAIFLIFLVLYWRPESFLQEYNNKTFQSIYKFNFLPDSFWVLITHLADTYTIIFYVIIFSLYLLIKKRMERVFLLLSIMILGHIPKLLIGYLVDFPRPGENIIACGDYSLPSFPSGHVFGAAIFLGSLYLMRDKKDFKTAAIFFVIVLLIGFSRIHIGCHWPADVLGSMLLGVEVILVVKIIKEQRSKKKER